MWTYSQSKGTFVGEGNSFAGYSGHGIGLDNPQLDNMRAEGPIPRGVYSIGPPKNPPDHLGPLAMPLEPYPANIMHGRSEFFIHGDNPAGNHTASDGCIILPHGAREIIALSTDRTLTVVE